jgi:hypothetical protein
VGKRANAQRRKFSVSSTVIDGEIIDKETWLPHSPDVGMCHFYLWGNLKQKIERSNRRTSDAVDIKVRNLTLDLTKSEIYCIAVKFYLLLEGVIVSKFCIVLSGRESVFAGYIFLAWMGTGIISCGNWRLLYARKSHKYFPCASLNIYLDETGF